ncbi:hypothetical protein BSZ35_08155 [Salinibacter sp. 10B]|uniref:glycosyltransferase family 2 protein n=1 Tax=Salinibacter sp. 10B TaxID=1923971 RepID=UPI000CF48872|nr:glycosyltransferase family 2 protein [Salinibacter sp. 10B]PQJ34573.1 hypothetical protein BSZ35_08155 [Salinibacter sp. 10B]
MPKITIVTPCYNAERFIGSTIESVQGQTLQNWEHIVVDDGSTDGSADIVETYVSNDESNRLRLLRQSNQGVCRARNVGFDARSSDSDYVLFLDADDCLKPDMLATLVAHMEDHPEVGLTYCLYDHLDADDNVTRSPTLPTRYRASTLGLHPVPDDVLETPTLSIFAGQAIPSVSLLRASLFERTDGFDEEIGQPVEDVDLFTQIALQSVVHRLPLHLVYYRRYEGQASQNTSRIRKHRKKLLAKWSHSFNEITEEHQRICRSLRYDWSGKLVPAIWLRAAKATMAQGKVVHSFLLLAGGIARYLLYTGKLLLSS